MRSATPGQTISRATDRRDEAFVLLRAVQTFLVKMQAEDGECISHENRDLLRRASAGLGWVQFNMERDDDLAGSSASSLDQEVQTRERLDRFVSGAALQIDTPQAGVSRPSPSPQALSAAISAKTGETIGIDDITPIWTATSKEIFAVTCSAASGWPRNAILRREPPIAVVATSLVDEYDVLKLAHDAGLPVPRPLFAESDPALLDGRVLMLERVPGRALELSEIGEAGPAIATDMGAFLGRLHTLNPDQVPRLRSDGRTIAERLASEIAKAREACDAGDQSPLLTAAFAWLDSHFAECVDEVPAIVHGDFDLRNLLIENGRLSAVLDWELSIRGHPAQDLGYAWPHVTQIGKWDDFMAAYTAAGGRHLPQKQVLFFAIWSQLWRIAVIVPLWRAFYRQEHSVLLLGSLRYLEQQVYLSDLARALRLAQSL